MSKKNIYIISFYILLYIIIYYISWIVWILELSLSLIIYTIIFYYIHLAWKKIRKKMPILFLDFVNYFLFRLSIVIFLVVWIIWNFSYYYNEISPAPMPEITISNWEKTVVFQAMSHIWTKNFYNTIVENIKKYKKDGYVYFFEWVKSWTKENAQKFDEALWVKFDEKLYENFSKLYWVTNQNNLDFIWLVNNLDFNVDLSLDEIIELYEKNVESNNENQINNSQKKIPIDVTEQITNLLLELNEKQLKILIYINKAILNLIIQSSWLQDTLTNNFTNKDLFDVILHKRNELLSETIINSEYNKIYVTYWLLHFKWVFELLQEKDQSWKIINTKNYYPIK